MTVGQRSAIVSLIFQGIEYKKTTKKSLTQEQFIVLGATIPMKYSKLN